MKKNAQVTIFIILGIVIFTVIGLLFYLTTTIKSKEFTEEKQEVTDLFTAQGKYTSYMQGCLDQTTKQGIALLGMQGGVIWDYQANDTKPFLGPRKYEYGQYVLPYKYEKTLNTYDGTATIFNISYGIIAPDLSLGIEGHPGVPDYPYGLTKLIEDPMNISRIYSNPFGNILLNPFPPLCDYYGANAPGQEGAVFSCETYDSKRKSDNDNVQEYLEKYITKAFKECVSLETLPEFSNTSIHSGNITISATFSPTSVSINAEYPIIADVSGKEGVLALQKFHTTVDVRLKMIHELASRLIENDVNNIFFNIARDANELVDCKEPGKEAKVTRCLKDGMQVIKYRDVCQTNGLCKSYGLYDDIVMIQDNKSTINGRPFVFAFAVQNRYPALEIIRNESAQDQYEYVVTEGDIISINPYGYDPDEDDHTAQDYMENRYIYGLWKVDYNEVAGVKTVGVTDGFNESTTWQTTQRAAEYTTQIGDKGEHTLLVQVCDNEGLCDFQNINILVEEYSP
ncbi:hypothetical protein HZC31_04930 [Candidatus Woesearchaeota archaeon]|nr:hypothetical protein [Candidatus Woesearchaeota archaeon]